MLVSGEQANALVRSCARQARQKGTLQSSEGIDFF